jgi:hypothetical protein
MQSSDTAKVAAWIHNTLVSSSYKK